MGRRGHSTIINVKTCFLKKHKKVNRYKGIFILKRGRIYLRQGLSADVLSMRYNLRTLTVKERKKEGSDGKYNMGMWCCAGHCSVVSLGETWLVLVEECGHSPRYIGPTIWRNGLRAVYERERKKREEFPICLFLCLSLFLHILGFQCPSHIQHKILTMDKQ